MHHDLDFSDPITGLIAIFIFHKNKQLGCLGSINVVWVFLFLLIVIQFIYVFRNSYTENVFNNLASILISSVVDRHIWIFFYCDWEEYINGFTLYLVSLLIGFQRVKVYRLNDDGKWDDQGTGHVTVDYLEVCKSFWCRFHLWHDDLVYDGTCKIQWCDLIYVADHAWHFFVVGAFICDWYTYYICLTFISVLWNLNYEFIIWSIFITYSP